MPGLPEQVQPGEHGEQLLDRTRWQAELRGDPFCGRRPAVQQRKDAEVVGHGERLKLKGRHPHVPQSPVIGIGHPNPFHVASSLEG